MKLIQEIIDRITPARMISDVPMIFVCGISRSGTTLLATVLDAHSRIGMGYELVPPPVRNIKQVAEQFEMSLDLAGGDFAKCSKALRRHEPASQKLAQWFMRCRRAGIYADELREILRRFAAEGNTSCRSYHARLRLASAVVERVCERTGADMTGFKLPGSQFGKCLKAFPNSYFIGIIRDPRDVFVSQKKRKFPVTPRQLSRSWKWKIRSFAAFRMKHPERAVMIRYEDLVRDPEHTLAEVFNILPVALEQSVFEFHASDASVFDSPHPETVNLRQGFFSGSIGRWRSRLEDSHARMITRACRKLMKEYAYIPVTAGAARTGKNFSGLPLRNIPRAELLARDLYFRIKSRYSSGDYFALLQPYLETHECMAAIDYVQIDDVGDRRVLMLRHDVDQDLETAVRMAEWEHDRSIRATYYLLHSAWYYGVPRGDGILHSRQLVECSRRIADLGHEVGLHNNLVLTALRHRVNPVDILRRELDFFRAIGIDIKGTAAHGDAFCRKNRFRNWELFAESCTDRFGGPRKVTVEMPDGPAEVDVGAVSMADHGLLYEAYDIGRDVYISDASGKINKGKPGPGKRPFGRHDPGRGHVVIILTHPMWWKFQPCPSRVMVNVFGHSLIRDFLFKRRMLK